MSTLCRISTVLLNFIHHSGNFNLCTTGSVSSKTLELYFFKTHRVFGCFLVGPFHSSHKHGNFEMFRCQGRRITKTVLVCPEAVLIIGFHCASHGALLLCSTPVLEGSTWASRRGGKSDPWLPSEGSFFLLQDSQSLWGCLSPPSAIANFSLRPSLGFDCHNAP